MNLTQTVRNLLNAPLFPAQPSASKQQMIGGSSFDEVLSGMTHYGQFRTQETMDVEASYKLAVSSAWIWSDIKLIADRVASRDANIEVKQRDDQQDTLENHPFLLLLDRPNSFMSGSFLKRYTVWWYLLRGNAYLFVSTPSVGSGEPAELWPLAANMMRPLPETLRQGQGLFSDRQVIDYEYNVNGKLEKLSGENIVHFRMPNPFDWWEGLSPLTAAIIGVQLDHAQAVWTRDFFKDDNAIPSAIISVPATTSPVDFDRQRAVISEQLKAGQKRIFTRSGDLSVETITQTLEQMQIIQSRQFSRDEIDRVYGVPEGLISGGLSGDSRLAAEIAFARNTVQPTLDYFAEQLSADLAIYYGEDILFEAPNVIPQDKALAVQEYTIYAQDRTINENRKELGMDEITLDDSLSDLQPFVDLPIRLLTIALANAQNVPVLNADAAQPEPPTPPQMQPGQQMPGQSQDQQQQDVGAMPGTQTPDQLTSDQSGKAIAIDTEIKRWKKVALREFKAGHNPGERPFESAVIDADRRTGIVEALKAATTESEVKAAFEPAPFRTTWQDYP